jgi:hypothetical protein
MIIAVQLGREITMVKMEVESPKGTIGNMAIGKVYPVMVDLKQKAMAVTKVGEINLRHQ